MILNARAEKGSSSSAFLVIGAPSGSFGLTPSTGGISNGEGK